MKNRPSAAVAEIRRIAPPITTTRASWAIQSRSHHCETVCSSWTLVPTRYATPADSRSPANIQPNAPTSSCWTSAGAGLTPSCIGLAGTAPGYCGGGGLYGLLGLVGVPLMSVLLLLPVRCGRWRLGGDPAGRRWRFVIRPARRLAPGSTAGRRGGSGREAYDLRRSQHLRGPG